ncbi:uncharacterized protein LOC125656548 [Ostrea edulis]|uniref:uncharacterized protein LOC125656548 n=1 Tax=Ostrea edulis TaxID=37623 RepID=UPI0024AF129D|nr:uncharacterized protein LOC125656548 [Ostrea edulis]
MSYYDLLRTCIAQYSFDCAENAQYTKIVQDMLTQKEIFCKKVEPVCDERKIQACFGKYVDIQNTNLENPETFPVLCRNYTDLVKCYREAATPCIQDPTFSQSPWEVLFGQVKTVCLSTPECPYYSMTTCSAMLYEGLSMVSTVPTSFFLDATCRVYSDFALCMEPLLVPCIVAGNGPYPEYFLQMQSTTNFMKVVCQQYKSVLLPHTEACYDKPSIQIEVDNTCTNPLGSVTFAGQPDEAALCRQTKSYIDCIKDFIGKECPGDIIAPLMMAAYQESWLLDSLSFIFGITCVPFGYANVTTKEKTTANYFPPGLIIPTTPAPPPPTTTRSSLILIKTTPTPKPLTTSSTSKTTPAEGADPSSPDTGSEGANRSSDTSSGSIYRVSTVVWGLLVFVVAFM